MNVGSDSYIVSFSVEPYQEEKVNVDINPQSLSFDSNTEQLSFTMTSNNSFSNNYTITTNLDVLTLSQESGTLQSRGQNTIGVTVKNRKEIDAARNGQIIINIEGNSYIVSVHIDKYVEGGGENETPATDVVDGLTAYFTFEGNLNDQTETGLSGVGIGTTFTDSFNGSQALSISANDNSVFSIPDGLIDQYEMSVSFWVKDLNDGHVFHAVSNDNKNTLALVMENGLLKYRASYYNLVYDYNKYLSFVHNKLSSWHMITIVSDYGKSSLYITTTKLYVDGIFTDVVTQQHTGGVEYRKCTKFVIGGLLTRYNNDVTNATRLVIDNLRFYKYRCLTDDEVKNIYNIERKSN